MHDVNMLDRPVWSALRTGWSPLAEGGKYALRMDRDYGPFGAAGGESPESLDALAAMVPPVEDLWLVQRSAIVAPPGTAIRKAAVLTQMVAGRIAHRPRTVQFVPLGEDDAAEMLALALLTVPGPFAAKTHRLGRFIGVKQDGKLIAMAGERMHMPGLREVSGVCTHPDHRGLGYAGALMGTVTERILDEGDTPFLHVYATNQIAIDLYERLGFRVRAPMVMAILGR